MSKTGQEILNIFVDEADDPTLFANPIYARLGGRFEVINQKFDGRLREIVDGMQESFRKVE